MKNCPGPGNCSNIEDTHSLECQALYEIETGEDTRLVRDLLNALLKMKLEKSSTQLSLEKLCADAIRSRDAWHTEAQKRFNGFAVGLLCGAVMGILCAVFTLWGLK